MRLEIRSGVRGQWVRGRRGEERVKGEGRRLMRPSATKLLEFNGQRSDTNCIQDSGRRTNGLRLRGTKTNMSS